METELKKIQINPNTTIENLQTELQGSEECIRFQLYIKKTLIALDLLKILGQYLSQTQNITTLSIVIGDNLFIGHYGLDLILSPLKCLINLKQLDLKICCGNQIGQQKLSALQQSLRNLSSLSSLKLKIDMLNNVLETDEDNEISWFEGLQNLNNLHISFKNLNSQIFLIKGFNKGMKYLVNLQSFYLKIKKSGPIDHFGFYFIGKEIQQLSNLKQVCIKFKNVFPQDQSFYFGEQSIQSQQNIYFPEESFFQSEEDCFDSRYYKDEIETNDRFIFGIIKTLKNLSKINKVKLQLCITISQQIFRIFFDKINELNKVLDLQLKLIAYEGSEYNPCPLIQFGSCLKKVKNLTKLNIKNFYQIDENELNIFICKLRKLKKLNKFSLFVNLQDFPNIDKQKQEKSQIMLKNLKSFKFKTFNVSIRDHIDNLNVCSIFKGLKSLQKFNFGISNENDMNQNNHDIDINSHFSESTNLKYLCLDFNCFQFKQDKTMLFLNNLAYLNQLQKLYLKFPNTIQMDEQQSNEFKNNILKSSNLRFLDIELGFQDQINKQPIQYLLQGCLQLQQLQNLFVFVHERCFSEDESKIFCEGISQFLNLKKLQLIFLESNLSSSGGINLICKSLEQLIQLKTLILVFDSNNNVESNHPKLIIQSLANLTQLKKLRINFNFTEQNSEDVQFMMSQLKSKKKLKILYLEFFTFHTFQIINLFKDLPFLKTISDNSFEATVNRNGQSRYSYELQQKQIQQNHNQSTNQEINQSQVNYYDIISLDLSIMNVFIEEDNQIEIIKQQFNKIDFPEEIKLKVSVGYETQLKYREQLISLFKNKSNVLVIKFEKGEIQDNNRSEITKLYKMKRLVNLIY